MLLRVLLIEDTPTDAELNLRLLRQTGIDSEWQVVDNETDFLAALRADWDVILADYTLPRFSVSRALHLLHERGLDIPLIVVTGTLGDERAVETIKEGAADYLLKDRMGRLGDAIRRAIEERRLRAAQRESEERFRRLSENAADIIFRVRVRPIPQIEYFSPAAHTILGYTPEELYSEPDIVSRLVHPDDRELVRRRFGSEDLMRQRVVQRWLHKNGAIVWMELHSVPVHDEAGNWIAIEGIARDVSERRDRDEALRRANEQMAVVLDALPIAIYATRVETDFPATYVSQSIERITGFSPQEFLDNPRLWASRLHPQDRDRVLAELPRISSSRHLELEYRWEGADGSYLWILDVMRLVAGPDGTPQVIGAWYDITGRRQIEEAEREQHALADALRDITAALITVLEIDTVMHRILENAGRVVPHDAANIMLVEGDRIRMAAWRGYPPGSEAFLKEFSFALNDLPSKREVLDRGLPAIISDTVLHATWRMFRETAWIRSQVSVPIRSHGQVIGLLNLNSTTPAFFTAAHAERLQAFADQAAVAIENAQLYNQVLRYSAQLEERVQERTAELNRAKEHVEAILNSSSDVIILTDNQGIIQQANPMFERVFKSPVDDFFSRPLTALAAPEYGETLQNALRAALETGQAQRVEVRACCQTNGEFDADFALSPIVEPDGQTLGIVCSLRDITTRKQLEARLRQMLEREMQLNELKSRFVSMASHEFRNPLAVIQTTSDLIRLYADRMTPEAKDAEFDRIRETVRNMTALLDDVLTISKAEAGKLTFEPALIDVTAFCQSLVDEFRRTTGADYRLVFACKAACDEAYLDPRLLRHIFSNLLSNAIKYSPIGSTITFGVDGSDDQITFRVTDQGIGIPEQDQPKLFGTFHRAENVGEIPGTGLGLAIVRQLVELHGGTVTFESQENAGTTFIVSIPRLTPPG